MDLSNIGLAGESIHEVILKNKTGKDLRSTGDQEVKNPVA